MIELKEKDIMISIKARNSAIIVTTINTDINALLICSLVGKITFNNSAFAIER